MRGLMKLPQIVASIAFIALAFAPSSFGVAQDLAVFKRTALESITKGSGVASKNIETTLVLSLVRILEKRPDEALKGIDSIIAENPNFRLAYLIKGDLLLARSRAISTLGNTNKAGTAVEDMRQEAKARLDRYLHSPPLDLVPRQILQMSPDQPYALLVDTARSRLYVYQNKNGEPRYITDYYISSGKNGAEKVREGDQKTPIGVYHVVSTLPKSKLTDFYGPGAFPISYPNEWDQREGRNGHGIWLHGTPSDTYSRPPRSSNGCVVLANQDLIEVSRYLRIGSTPVIISSKAEWVDSAKWQAERNKILATLENWKRDWESRDIDRYLSHYHKHFTSEGRNLASWATQKRAVNAAKTDIRVDLSNVSVFTYPGYENMVVVSFEQSYKSNNLAGQMKKRQYWLRDGNRWQIVYEGSVDAQPSTAPPTLTAQR